MLAMRATPLGHHPPFKRGNDLGFRRTPSQKALNLATLGRREGIDLFKPLAIAFSVHHPNPIGNLLTRQDFSTPA